MENMRRSDRQMTDEAAKTLLAKAVYGVLSTVGADGCPYGIPVNYAYVDEHIYMHFAVEGKKLNHIAFNPKVSFVAVGEGEVLSEQFSMSYESVMAFGEMVEVLDLEEKIQGLMHLVEKYSPRLEVSGEKYARSAVDKTRVYKFKVDHMTGKERRK